MPKHIDQLYDEITALADLEHIPTEGIPIFNKSCADYLKPNGKLIITVSSPAVDTIFNILKYFKLITGMSLGEHYGFQVTQTSQIREAVGFILLAHRKIQLGLYNLFMFQLSPRQEDEKNSYNASTFSQKKLFNKGIFASIWLALIVVLYILFRLTNIERLLKIW